MANRQQTISTNLKNDIKTGRWSPQEHERFLQALEKPDQTFQTISDFVGTRNISQIRSHHQKYCNFLERQAKSIEKQPRVADTLDSNNNPMAATRSKTPANLKIIVERPEQEAIEDSEVAGEGRNEDAMVGEAEGNIEERQQEGEANIGENEVNTVHQNFPTANPNSSRMLLPFIPSLEHELQEENRYMEMEIQYNNQLNQDIQASDGTIHTEPTGDAHNYCRYQNPNCTCFQLPKIHLFRVIPSPPSPKFTGIYESLNALYEDQPQLRRSNRSRSRRQIRRATRNQPRSRLNRRRQNS